MNITTNILLIFAITYAGLAMGRIPGLKMNRAGIALLGAIAMLIFGNVTTQEAIGYVNWPTVCLLFGFFVISAQLRLSGFYNVVAGKLSAQMGHPARFQPLQVLNRRVEEFIVVAGHGFIVTCKTLFAPTFFATDAAF